MLLQAYDFVHLPASIRLRTPSRRQRPVGQHHRRHRSWAAACAGAQLFGIDRPLLTKSDGTKMGKTESGAFWLSHARTSPYAFYQYWINVEDADAGKCLRYFTDLTRDEIEVARPGSRAQSRPPRKPAPAGRGDYAAGARPSGTVHGAAGHRNSVRRGDQRTFRSGTR